MYVDADYAVASNNRRSVPGISVMLGDTVMGCVTTVKCEAGYIALCDAPKKILFVEFL